jgi:hypothetical protein
MLIAAARAGRWFDGAAGNGCAEIDAAVLRGLCCDQRDDVDAAGIRLRNVHIRESLDLAGVEVPFPLRLDGCRFDGPLQLDGARLHRLDLTNCPDVPGVVANGLEVRRDLNLSGSTITAAHATTASESRTAAVWLCESHIGGSLFLVDSQDGRRPTVRGGMDMTGARVAAQVVVRNATIARPSTSPGGGSAPRRARETAIRAAGRRSLHRPRPSTATRTSGREPQLPWPHWSTWYPNRESPWGAEMDLWLNLSTLLGWVLSSIFLVSFTRLARSA